MGTTPLSGYRVVDLGSGVAAAYCTKILADAGADVVKVEAPEGDPLRRWSASGAAIPPGDDGALFQFLQTSRRAAVADPDDPAGREFVLDLVGAADAVLWTSGSRLADHPSFTANALRAAAPDTTVAAITPFGLTGPWAARPATDLTIQAWAGVIGARGTPDRPPVSIGGRPSGWTAGVFAAVGMLASRHRTLATGVTELLDVSMLEAVNYAGNMYPMTSASMNRALGSRVTSTRTVSSNLPGIEPTKDGWVGLMVVTVQHWRDFCVLIGKHDWLEDESLYLYKNRHARREEILAGVHDWTMQRTSAEIVELANGLRIPAAFIGNGATIPGFDHLVERHAFVANPRSGFLQPDVPYRMSGGAEPRPFAPAPRLGEHTAALREGAWVAPSGAEPPAAAAPGAPAAQAPVDLPFAGLRIADFTAMVAGPIVASFLGMLGADVIHVESTKHPDSMRGHTVLTAQDDRWWEYSPLYHGPNTNKRGITLDLADDRGRDLALRLIAQSDVIIENASPRVMENFGLDYEHARAVRPDIIMLRLPAFGLDGPWRNRTAYAAIIEQTVGMAWITGYPDGPPTSPNGICDGLAGTHATAALLMALEYRRRTGKGMLLECTPLGSGLNVAAEQTVEFSANGALLDRTGNAGGPDAVQDLFLSAPDGPSGHQRRVAVAIATDEQWRGLRTLLGDPAWARGDALATAAGRLEARETIVAAVAEWCATRSADDIVAALWDTGVPVGKVLMPAEIASLDHLAARGTYQLVEHPLTGRNVHSAYPVRFSAGPARFHRTPPPTLGQHNHEVLSTVLGLSHEEIVALERDGVIGERVANENYRPR